MTIVISISSSVLQLCVKNLFSNPSTVDVTGIADLYITIRSKEKYYI